MPFYNEIISEIKSRYPAIGASDDDLKKISRIATPHRLQLSKRVLESAQKFISEVFRVRCSPEYLARFPSFDPGNYSVLMAYDFHLTDDETLKLIEINTNGASSLIADILYRKHGQEEVSKKFLASLKSSFLNEFGKASGKVSIIDDNFKKQNSYVEFLMFQELFRSWGFTAEVCNPEDYLESDFIYNRLTDFYFREPYSRKINEAYINKKTIVTPNPHEYDLLANKMRLQYLAEIPTLSANIPKVKAFSEYNNPEDLWAERKKYFFKPIEAYGSRGAFKGESISRKLFNEIFNKNYLAQELVRPPIWQDFKWDLRFYVYKSEIQLVAARLYKGQTTNFQEEGTGLATVDFF